MIDVLLLGTSGMHPTTDRWLSSALVRYDGELILFDCGEGTQIPWRRSHWGFRRLSTICISHWHADHIAGLPGVLFSVANAGRTEPVTLYGPAGIAPIVAGLRVIAPALPFTLEVVELDDGDAFDVAPSLAGRVARGVHGLPSLAYRLDLARARRFERERAEALGVPRRLWRTLQGGEPVRWETGSASPHDVLSPPRRGLSLGFVTDTRPLPSHVPFLHGVDLLICEATYGDPSDAAKAANVGHMTFAEAAGLARDAEAHALWLTHFSPALQDPETWRREATDRFPPTTIGHSGLTTQLTFPREG